DQSFLHPLSSFERLSPRWSGQFFALQSSLYAKSSWPSSGFLLSDKISYSPAQIVARMPKGFELRPVIANYDRIFDAPVDAFRRPGKDWAMLASVITYCNHVIKRGLDEFVQ